VPADGCPFAGRDRAAGFFGSAAAFGAAGGLLAFGRTEAAGLAAVAGRAADGGLRFGIADLADVSGDSDADGSAGRVLSAVLRVRGVFEGATAGLCRSSVGGRFLAIKSACARPGQKRRV